MNISFDIVGIFISTFICFSLASLWFSPALFGKIWMVQIEKNGSSAKTINELSTFVNVFIFLMCFSFVINFIIAKLHIVGMRDGMEVGVIIWFLITTAHAAIHFAFERRSIILFWIYSSYYLSASVIMSTLLAMRR